MYCLRRSFLLRKLCAELLPLVRASSAALLPSCCCSRLCLRRRSSWRDAVVSSCWLRVEDRFSSSQNGVGWDGHGSARGMHGSIIHGDATGVRLPHKASHGADPTRLCSLASTYYASVRELCPRTRVTARLKWTDVGLAAGSRTVLAIGPAPDSAFVGLTDHLKLL